MDRHPLRDAVLELLHKYTVKWGWPRDQAIERIDIHLVKYGSGDGWTAERILNNE